MESNKTLIDKEEAKVIKEFGEDPRGLSQQKSLILAKFLSEGSDKLVSKELMLKCLQTPSEVTSEEYSKIMQYHQVMLRDFIAEYFPSDASEKLKRDNLSDVSRIIDEDSGEVKKISATRVDDALQPYPDLIPILQEDHSIEDYDQKNAATNDDVDTLGSQDYEIG